MMKVFENILIVRENSQFLILFLSFILTAALLNIPGEVEAEEPEPAVNFFIERELLGHSDDISSLAWSPNGQWIASGSFDNTTRIWSTETWSTIKTLNHPAPVEGISTSKNTFRLAISHGNGTIEIWNSVSWTLIQTLLEHQDAVLGLSWSPDGTKLSTGDNSGNITIWDATTWNSVEILMMPSGVNDLQWSNNGEKLAACSSDGTISVWETSTWTSIQSFDTTSGDQSVESIAWNRNDTKLASSSEENQLKIWNTTSWTAMHIQATESNPKKLSWNNDDSLLAVSVLGGIQIWDTAQWNVLNSTQLEESHVTTLSFHPSSDILASNSPLNTNDTVMVWEKNFSPVLDPIGDQNAVEDQPFTFYASASDDDQLTFSDDSSLFDINPVTGLISFTPENDDVGEHVTTITVSDGKGGFDGETITFIVMNVDDPPVPILKWNYGADYVNITLRVGGQAGNSVALIIEEEGIPIDDITVERSGEALDEGSTNLSMNLSSSYEATLEYQGSTGENPVAITFERGGFAFTKHIIFDSGLGTEQTEELQISEFFKAMGLVVFDASASIDVDNQIIKYKWNFGDDTSFEGVAAVHSFSENSDYIVNLTVESDNFINRSITTVVSLQGIPDTEDYITILKEDSTLQYLESTDQRAVFIDTRKHLEIEDNQGKITGFSGGSYSFEIEGIDLVYSSNSGEAYYIPNDLEVVYNIAESQESYELSIIIPNSEFSKTINIFGGGGGDTIEFEENGDTFTIATEQIEKVYSLSIESEGGFGTETFTLTNMNLSSGEKHHYSINNWEGLTNDGEAVTLGIDNEGDGEIDVSIDLQNGMTGEEVQIIIMNRGKSSSGFFTTINMVLIVGFVSIAGVGCLLGSTEVGKLALISLILPLYTRIKKAEVLNNEIRGMIRGYIIANPGDNYNSIKKALGLNNGSLAYHLKVLERAELIKSRQDGMFKRFYPAGMRIPHENGGEISEIQRVLLLEIAGSPGISQKEIAALLGLSKGVVNYHVKILRDKKMLKIEKRGRKTYCYANPNMLKRIKKAPMDKIKEV
jgi:WD40 repeat protein/DNA-binding transcriptional ArsR family regulator